MTLGKKLSLTIAGLLALLLLVGAISTYSLSSLNETTKLIITDPLPGMVSIASTRAAALTLRGDVWRHIATRDAATKSELERNIQALRQQISGRLADYERTISTPEDRTLFEKLQLAFADYMNAYPVALAMSREAKMDEAAANHSTYVTPKFKVLQGALDSEFNFNKSRGESLAALSQQRFQQTIWILSTLIVLSIFAGATLAFLVIRSTNRVLRQAVSDLSEGAQQLASAASQVAGSSQSLAQGSSEQAASLEETSASTEEISSMARTNSGHSTQASHSMTQALQIVLEANTQLDQMVVSMNEITDSSGKISTVIKAIEGIAFQTNILALNAAVEAARAGEAGMGFAVVAEEVRNLAHRSAQAAKDTAGLIQESIEKSTLGRQNLDLLTERIKTITASAHEAKTLVEEVSLGSQQQAQGVQQLAKAITQMEQVTQSIAANAEESAAAAEQLSSQSETLKEVVQRLTVMVGT